MPNNACLLAPTLTPVMTPMMTPEGHVAVTLSVLKYIYEIRILTTILIYTTGAGVMAACGTKFVLQSIPVNRYEMYSFRTRSSTKTHVAIFPHYFPVLGVGDFPYWYFLWMW